MLPNTYFPAEKRWCSGGSPGCGNGGRYIVALYQRRLKRRTPSQQLFNHDKRFLISICSACLISLTGCMVGPDFVRPQIPGPDRYISDTLPKATISAAGEAQNFDQAAVVAE